MGYCSINDFEKVLAQTLTTASPNPVTIDRPAKLADLGKKLNLTDTQGSSVGTYSLSDINYYIRQAMSMVDAALSQQYVVPLRTKVQQEQELLADITEYVDDIVLSNASLLIPGDILILHDGVESEEFEVDYVEGDIVSPVSAISGIYSSDTTRVLLVSYPDPIPYVTARLACAQFYDKWARAQQEPAQTEYGETLRKEAHAELNNIREGRTILHGIDRIGSRFVNPNLYSRYAVDHIINQDGSRSDDNRK